MTATPMHEDAAEDSQGNALQVFVLCAVVAVSVFVAIVFSPAIGFVAHESGAHGGRVAVAD